MSLDQQTLDSLRTVISNDPELQQRLQASADVASATATLHAAAAAHGIALDETALREHFASTAAACAEDLDDERLAAVAGGITTGGFYAMSLFTLTIGCWAYSDRKPGSGVLTCAP